MPSDGDDMRSAGAVIERLFLVFGAKNDPDLAKKMGKSSRTTVSAWRTRNSVPYTECIQAAAERGLSLDWLLLGVGEMQRQQSDVKNESIDEGLLSDIIAEIEDVCTAMELSLPARKKAEAIILLYDHFRPERTVKRPAVVRVLRLVA